MTAPGGSRNAVASRSPRDDDDEVRDDDPKLRAMRTVWLAMRDEDPPERGLAELLAAARATAGTMHARPTLWQRLIAGLRRPPALAFATVLVLVGGAVIVGRRIVEVPAARAPAVAEVVTMEPAPAATPAPSRPDIVDGVAGNAAPGEASAADERAAAADERASAADERAAAAGERAAAADGSSKVELASERTRQVEGSGKAALAVTGAGPGGARTGSGTASAKPAAVVVISGLERRTAGNAPAGADLDDTDVGAAEAVAPPVLHGPASPAAGAPTAGSTADAAGPRAPRPPAARAQPGSTDDLAAAESTVRNDPPPPAAAIEATKKAERVAPTITRKDKEQAAPAVPLDQLYKQCEAAARRGDCAAVRLMVGRIARSDRGYRARIAKGSPVAKCLAE